MRASLHFNLNDQDDIMAHLRCTKATDMALALLEFTQKFYRICDESEDGKYIDEKLIREAMDDALSHYHINLNELLI